MSYARSPRPVCSITIGTSIIFGSFTVTCHTPAPTTVFTCGEDRKWSAKLCGLMIQKIEGLLVADSVSNPIEGPIACQTRAHRLRGLFRLLSESFDLLNDFFIADFDLFEIGNLVEQQGSLHFLDCLVTLTCP